MTTLRHMTRHLRLVPILALALAAGCATAPHGRATPARDVASGGGASTVWTKERARAWADSTGWIVGSNYAPSTAVNQLEMWQPATFDPRTIDRELGYAQSLGFNTMRVFLHHML